MFFIHPNVWFFYSQYSTNNIGPRFAGRPTKGLVFGSFPKKWTTTRNATTGANKKQIHVQQMEELLQSFVLA